MLPFCMFVHTEPRSANQNLRLQFTCPPITLTPLVATHTKCSQITENTNTLSPAFATHADFAPVTPVSATHTKTTGVYTNNSHSGTHPMRIVTFSSSLSFQRLTNCPLCKSFVLTFMHRMGGVGGSGELSSQKISRSALSALDRELSHRCSAIRALQNAAERARLAAHVAHTEDPRRSRIPSFRRACHESNFFAFHHQRRARFRHRVAGEHQPHALPVHLPARSHALHDLLPCVAALRVTDMAVLQSRFVRDLLFAEVVAEPRNALRQPQAAQRSVTHRPAAVFPRSIQQNFPECRKFLALDYELRAGNSARRTLHNPAGNCTDSAVRGRKFAERPDVYAGNFTD